MNGNILLLQQKYVNKMFDMDVYFNLNLNERAKKGQGRCCYLISDQGHLQGSYLSPSDIVMYK